MSGYLGQEIDVFGPHEGVEYKLEAPTQTKRMRIIPLDAFRCLTQQALAKPDGVESRFLETAVVEGWRIPVDCFDYDTLMPEAWRLQAGTRAEVAAGRLLATSLCGRPFVD